MTDPWSADFDDLRVFSLAMQNKLELSVCLNADAKLKKWEAMLTCYNFYVLLVLSFQLSVFLELCIRNTLVYFLLR